MQKKGDLSLETIIVAALVLFVLVVVIAIFSGQIKEYAKGFWEIGKDAQEQAEGEKCATLIGDKICADNCPEGYNPTHGECSAGKQCCEKIPKEK